MEDEHKFNEQVMKNFKPDPDNKELTLWDQYVLFCIHEYDYLKQELSKRYIQIEFKDGSGFTVDYYLTTKYGRKQINRLKNDFENKTSNIKSYCEMTSEAYRILKENDV